MAITVPDVVPTRGIEQLLETNPTIDQVAEFARSKEADYERLKLYHDNLLQGGFSPYLPTPAIADEELEHIIHEAGWTFQKDKFGTVEEWQMWTNRFRRLIAIVKAGAGGGGS